LRKYGTAADFARVCGIFICAGLGIAWDSFVSL